MGLNAGGAGGLGVGKMRDLPQNYVRVRRCMFEQSGRYYCTVGRAVRVVVGLSSS